jgi:hypothetical protein
MTGLVNGLRLIEWREDMRLIPISIAACWLLASPLAAQPHRSVPGHERRAPADIVNTAPVIDSVYVVSVANGTPQFGTVNLFTGAFHQIGPSPFDGQSGLVPLTDGSFLTLGFTGNLDRIDRLTGATSIVGPTGLDDCLSSASPCGPTSAANLASLAGTVYATDFSNNLYTVDVTTGHATLIGSTGIPPFTFNPTIPVDGAVYLFDYSLFSSGGQLYEIFDVAIFDPAAFTMTTVIPANLYRIDPSTAVATFIASTDMNITAVVDVNGTPYAFNAWTNQVVTLDLATGITTPLSDLDPQAGLILGAFPVPPVPASKDDCRNGGWQYLARADGGLFRNQGSCIAYLETSR